MSSTPFEKHSWQFNETASYAMDIAGHKGHKGVLDMTSVDYLTGKLERERADGPLTRQYGEDIVQRLNQLLPDLRAHAMFTEGGGLDLHASAMRPTSIPHAEIRTSAAAVAEMFNIGRHESDHNDLNFVELTEAIHVLNSSSEADATTRSALLDKAGQPQHELQANLEVVRGYMKSGNNGLLVSGTVQIKVGLRNFRGKRRLVTRRLKIFELPDYEGNVGGSIESEDAARKRAETLDAQFMSTACDRLYLYSNQRLYVALNPGGDIKNLGMERRVQLFDNKGQMSETAVVIVQRDVRNSVGESTVGWYLDAATAMGRKAEAMSDPNSKGAQMIDAKGKPSSVNESGTGMLALAAGAGIFASLSIRVPQLALGVAVFGAVPIAINLIKYATNKKTMTPVENAMGVTVTRGRSNA
jgi:hypothetical protein